MAEAIDEARIIAWLDGELPESEAVEMAEAVAADPALAALADRHRRLQARFTAAFDPIAAPPVRATAPVISLAAVRAERAERAERAAKRAKAARPARLPSRWRVPGAIAASLLIGVLGGHFIGPPAGVADRAGALALSPQIARALDTQLSSDAGVVRVALSFRNQSGDYCRNFSASRLAGIACRTGGGWQLRYGTAIARPAEGAYRTAGSEDGIAQVVAATISGEPLDRAGEAAARSRGWR